MNIKYNSTIEYEFCDGTKTAVTLTIYRLLQLKSKNKPLYDLTSRVLSKGTEDVEEMVKVLYTAYLCANIENYDSVMSLDDFMILCGADIAGIGATVNQLVNPKKLRGFRSPFQKKTKPRKTKIRPPKFEIEDIEDMYTYYVLILEIPEEIFWHADYAFLISVVENKTAYDAWLNYAIEKQHEK